MLERGENLPLFARIHLETGGFTGKLTDEGGQVIFETPNGAEITILGTQFWIIYDPADQVLGVGNFEGTTVVAIRDISLAVRSNHYVIVRPGQPPEPERLIPMTRAELEELFRQQRSAVPVLRALLEETPTPTPTVPADTPTLTYTTTSTPTPSPTLTSTPACPPRLEVVQNAFCRAGPGTNWVPRTGFLPGISLEPKGLSPFQPLWWYVAIPSGGSCWISDLNVNIIGEASCLPIIPVPPTYTPTPTQTYPKPVRVLICPPEFDC
jgi:hypothetical protein